MAGRACPGERLLWELLASHLTGPEWFSLEGHIRVCPTCQVAMAKHHRMSHVAHAVRAVLVTDAATEPEALPGGDPVVAMAANSPAPEALEAEAGIPSVRSPGAPEAPASADRSVAIAAGTPPDRVAPPGPSGSLRVAGVLVAAGLVVAALAARPVRLAAAGLLQQFRVNDIRTVAVEPDRLASLDSLVGSIDDVVTVQSVNGVAMEDASVVAIPVAGLAAAAEMLPFELRTPGSLPPPRSVQVTPGGRVVLEVDGKGLVDLVAAVGLDASSISPRPGTLEIDVAPGVELLFDAPGGPVALHAVPAPEISVPADWDVEGLGRLYLVALGLSPSEARAVAATIDWTSTLILPVAAGAAEIEDVSVDGQWGFAFTRRRGAGVRSGVGSRRPLVPHGPAGSPMGIDAATLQEDPGAWPQLLWERDGVLYVLTGAADVPELVALADDLG